MRCKLPHSELPVPAAPVACLWRAYGAQEAFPLSFAPWSLPYAMSPSRPWPLGPGPCVLCFVQRALVAMPQAPLQRAQGTGRTAQGASRASRKGPVPLCDIPSGCCSFTGPWTVTRSSLRMLRRVATFCRPLQPVLLLVSFPRSRSPVVGVLGLC